MKSLGEDFPQDPYEAADGGCPRGIPLPSRIRVNTYRRMNDIPHSWALP